MLYSKITKKHTQTSHNYDLHPRPHADDVTTGSDADVRSEMGSESEWTTTGNEISNAKTTRSDVVARTGLLRGAAATGILVDTNMATTVYCRSHCRRFCDCRAVEQRLAPGGCCYSCRRVVQSVQHTV